MDPDITQNFDSMSLPLSSPFLGESGLYEVYGTGDNTGNYTVSYTPLVRGNYSVTVKRPAVWETQLVQTVVETTGEDLSGDFVMFCFSFLFSIVRIIDIFLIPFPSVLVLRCTYYFVPGTCFLSSRRVYSGCINPPGDPWNLVLPIAGIVWV